MAQQLEKVHILNTSKIVAGRGFHFIVIGAGGTGGYLIPNLARQISIGNAIKTMHHLTIADADNVELSNLVRQNFIQKDVGSNKANVLASRYSGAFGMEIGTVNDYIETKKQLSDLISLYEFSVPVIIGCVDNNKSRQLIYRTFSEADKPLFWIDSGNEEYHGQVVIGFNTAFTDKDKDLFYLPSIADVYPDVMEDKATKFISEMSCAEKAVSHPQCIATNITAANIIFNMANNLMSKATEGTKVGMVTFNTYINGFNHHLCTDRYLKQRYTGNLQETEPMIAVAAG